MDAALPPCSGSAASGASGEEQQQAGGSGSGVHAALLTAQAHAAYAAASSEGERRELARQADAMLAGTAGVPALAAQPAAVLRSHWLLRMQLEWEAAAAARLDLRRLAKRRRQRRWGQGARRAHGRCSSLCGSALLGAVDTCRSALVPPCSEAEALMDVACSALAEPLLAQV